MSSDSFLPDVGRVGRQRIVIGGRGARELLVLIQSTFEPKSAPGVVEGSQHEDRLARGGRSSTSKTPTGFTPCRFSAGIAAFWR